MKKKERISKTEKSDAMAKSAAQEVPYILAAHGELHIASILERLRERGYSKIKYQSLSAELSVNTKNKRLYNALRRRRSRFAPKSCARSITK